MIFPIEYIENDFSIKMYYEIFFNIRMHRKLTMKKF